MRSLYFWAAERCIGVLLVIERALCDLWKESAGL